jgi:Flp pilus assembly protein TadG
MRTILKDISGNVVLIFALTSAAVMGAIGFAMGYAGVVQARGKIADAADAAVLAAVSANAIDVTASDATQIAASRKMALDWFQAAVPGHVTLVSYDATVAKSGTLLTATLDYKASIESAFSGFYSPTIEFAGTAKASFAAAYIDVVVLVDTSQSMGLGADLATQTKMTSDPKVNWCALACHGNPGEPDTVTAAHAAGYKLRIDVVKEALAAVIADAKTVAQQTRATIRIGLYSVDTQFHTIAEPTSDYTALQSAAATLDIAHWGAGSSLKYGLDKVKAAMSTPGTGTSPASPMTFVMLLSDGVANAVDNQSTGWWNAAATAYPAFSGKTCWSQTPPPDAGPWYAPTGAPAALPCVPDPWTSTHGGNGQMELNAIEPDWCRPIKSAGARLLTLYTEYVLLPDASTSSSNWATNDWRLPLIKQSVQPKLKPNMAACASRAGDAYVANDVATVTAGIRAMFSTVFASAARLTQ